MNEKAVSNLGEFLTYLHDTDMDTGHWGFRGVTSDDYDLVPSIGRTDLRVAYDSSLERQIFDKFRQMAVPFVGARPDNLVTVACVGSAPWSSDTSSRLDIKPPGTCIFLQRGKL